MIRLINISKNYPFGHHALKNINIHLEPGEMAFLTGHSGAGKTTLLKILLLVEKMSRGQAFLKGYNLAHLPKRAIPYLRRQIGMVFQNPHLLMRRSVYENVAIPLIITGMQGKDVRSRVQAALDKVGLLDKAKLYPLALSTGEQQRVGIARAIVNRPAIILADEPTGNLDPHLSREIMDLFESFQAIGTTLLIATHDLTLIAGMKHRIITLKKGELIHGGNNA